MKYEIGKVYDLQNPKSEITLVPGIQPEARDAEAYLLSGDVKADAFLASTKIGILEPVQAYLDEEGNLCLNTGLHRYTASLINKTSLPFRLVEKPLKSDSIALQVHSNQHRAMGLLSKGQSYLAYIDTVKEETGKAPTQKEVAEKMGVTSAEVSQAVTMAKAPTAIVSAIEKGAVSVKAAQSIIKVAKATAQKVRSEWNKENKDQLSSADEATKESLLESCEKTVNKEVESVAKDELRKFKEKNGKVSRGRPRKEDSSNGTTDEKNLSEESTQSPESENEFQMSVSSDDSLEDIVMNLASGLEDTHNCTLSELLETVENLISKQAFSKSA